MLLSIFICPITAIRRFIELQNKSKPQGNMYPSHFTRAAPPTPAKVRRVFPRGLTADYCLPAARYNRSIICLSNIHIKCVRPRNDSRGKKDR